MTQFNYYTQVFMEMCRIERWGMQIDPTIPNVVVTQNEKTVEFDYHYLEIYNLHYLARKITETFESIPNDPKMKKSKRWRKLTL